jgi:hypothetical protein
MAVTAALSPSSLPQSSTGRLEVKSELLRRHWQELAVAKRPMAATSCARSGGTHVGAPEDDGDVVRKGEPRKV